MGFSDQMEDSLMSKQTIFLADSSYAIRKITERNFAEETNYSLVTFKSGQGLREQLLEVRPHVVLIELKLPEWSGYEVCRFINSEPSLKNTRIYLLRAAFDPVEEEKLLGMVYMDIITKPFDHAVLIENIEKLADAPEEEVESTPPPIPTASEMPEPELSSPEMPEDFPEIDDFDAPSEDLSFSDLKTVISEEPARPLADPDLFPPPHRAFEITGDDVQPSEEITQGSIPSGRDPLSPPPPMDEIDNPFADDSLHEQIKEQEIELGIGSITQEALAIEAAIAQSAPESVSDWTDSVEEDEAEKGDTSEAMPSALTASDTDDDDFKNFSFDDGDAISFPGSTVESENEEPEEADAENEEPEGFEINVPDEIDSFDRPKSPSFLDLAAPQDMTDEGIDVGDEFTEPSTESENEEIPHWASPPAASPFDSFKEEPELGADAEDLVEETELPAFSELEPADEEEPVSPGQFDDFPGIDDPSKEDVYSLGTSPEPDNSLTSETQAIPEEPSAQDEAMDLDQPKAVMPMPPPIPTPSAPAVTSAAPSLENMTSTDREIIMQRIENNISQTLKDILWDIIPPIAERIIKEEIESIKKEIAQSID
jgi:CheY-like chemotaxis protein